MNGAPPHVDGWLTRDASLCSATESSPMSPPSHCRAFANLFLEWRRTTVSLISSTFTLQQTLAVARSVSHRPSSLSPALDVHALTYALMEHVISRVNAAANKYVAFIIKKGGSVFPPGFGGGGGGGGVSTLPSPPSYLPYSAQHSVALLGHTAALDNLDTTPASVNTTILRPCSAALSPLLCTALRCSVGHCSGSG